MWTLYRQGSYLILENGNKVHRRLAENVEVRKQTTTGTKFLFNDRYDTYLIADVTEIEDIDRTVFTADTLVGFLSVNTGSCCATTPKNPVPHADGGFIVVDSTNAAQDLSLVIPAGSLSATIMIEADAASTAPTKALRFTENDTTPTTTEGMFLGDGDIYVLPFEAFGTFSFVSGVTDEVCQLHIQFFK